MGEELELVGFHLVQLFVILDEPAVDRNAGERLAVWDQRGPLLPLCHGGEHRGDEVEALQRVAAAFVLTFPAGDASVTAVDGQAGFTLRPLLQLERVIAVDVHLGSVRLLVVEHDVQVLPAGRSVGAVVRDRVEQLLHLPHGLIPSGVVLDHVVGQLLSDFLPGAIAPEVVTPGDELHHGLVHVHELVHLLDVQVRSELDHLDGVVVVLDVEVPHLVEDLRQGHLGLLVQFCLGRHLYLRGILPGSLRPTSCRASDQET